MKPHHWQPIETAPKDGTPIMVWRHGWYVAVVAKWGHHPDVDGLRGWISKDADFPGSLDYGFILGKSSKPNAPFADAMVLEIEANGERYLVPLNAVFKMIDQAINPTTEGPR